MIKENKVSFAYLAVNHRKIKEDFFNQINLLVDWRPLDK